MAAYTEESDEELGLDSHPIFAILQENAEEQTSYTDPKELMVVQDSQVFIWDKGSTRILTANLKDVFADDGDDPLVQALVCSNTPRFDVEHISLNLTGRHILLWGKHGATVMELPRRYGKNAQYEGGKERINCRTIGLAERFFISSSSLSLLQAEWHPGSASDTHVLLLTTDNTLRIYEISNPHKAAQVHGLGEHSTSFSLSSSRSTFEVALGEIAVSFDFGLPVECAARGGAKAEDNLLYPVYILKGNGDIFLLNISLTDSRYFHTKLQGPLTMQPAAEDNYGMDACSLLCLHSNPPVLVVATSSSALHHCVVLSSEERSETEDVTSDSQLSVASMADYGPTLCVYESVELALSLVQSDLDEYEDDVNYPIKLHRDPTVSSQYFCSHAAGVHHIILPWLQKIEQFYATGDGEEEGEAALGEITRDQACTVAHMVCTKPSGASSPAPVLGLTIITDQLLGPTFMCLTPEMGCYVKSLRPVDVGEPPKLLSEEGTDPVVSPMRQLNTEPFQRVIQRLLHRTQSNPVLRASSKTHLSLEESFQLLQRATKVLRDEYIQKQELAREEIEKRMKILRQQKELQQSDLQDSQQLEEETKAKAEELADRYSDAEEKQEELINRVWSVLHALQNQLPVLSEAEHGMNKELTDMQEKLKQMQVTLQQVNRKHEYQQQQANQQSKQASSPALSQSQHKHLKTLLKEETDRITALVSEVKNLSVAVGP
ncbi:nucleoporin 88-like [Amphiura filiformis]|uniref:nucleoporin 88-like n=1 Tax=Amphiura filiformis TaxID=82378 RepID=UPI003B221EE1